MLEQKGMSMRNGCSLLMTTLVVITALLIISGCDASASYLDPGTGSYFFQIAVAALFGGGFTLRAWFQCWRKGRARKRDGR